MLVEWDVGHLSELVDLCGRALPGEALTDDELRACWDDGPGAVLAHRDRSGVVAVVTRGRAGHVRLIVVDPSVARRGLGRGLLAGSESWLRQAGCSSSTAGGEAPFYLWPGVDAQWTSAVALFTSAGYRMGDLDVVNMTFSTRFRAAPPEGISIRRAGPADVVTGFVAAHWPGWSAETERAVARGTCFVAADAADEVVGFVCHSVVRGGWLGPMGTDPDRHRGGIGRALLGAVAEDIEVLGRDEVVVEWVGPQDFYAHVAGARVSRTFKRLQRPL